MRNFVILLSVAFVSGLAGCSSPPVVLAPVGPNPNGLRTETSTGTLQVYSKVIVRTDDRNQGGDGLSNRHQFSYYTVYDTLGKPVKHVENAARHYAQSPEQVALPPGDYVVKAQAKDYFRVNVPVTIKSGQTTRVHLDDNWTAPPEAKKSELVVLPDGNPVGWRSY